jgi:hypothetical protein
LKFYNNIVYTPDVGLITYVQDCVDIELYNNVFWGVRAGTQTLDIGKTEQQHTGAYGGIALGKHITNLKMYNNIILSINLNHLQVTYDATVSSLISTLIRTHNRD